MKLIAKRLIKEGNFDEVVKLYMQLVTPTRKEEGCISYELFQDEKNNRLVAVIEEWQNKEAFEKHLNTPHFTSLIPMINDLTEIRYTFEVFNKLI